MGRILVCMAYSVRDGLVVSLEHRNQMEAYTESELSTHDHAAEPPDNL